MTDAALAKRPAKVLLVEDDASTSKLLEVVLKKQGYDVRPALDGERALEIAPDFLPDAVLLDLQLPGLSGLDVLKALRGDARHAGIAIIVLSASSIEQAGVDVVQLGATGHCTKPIPPLTLAARLREFGVPPLLY